MCFIIELFSRTVIILLVFLIVLPSEGNKANPFNEIDSNLAAAVEVASKDFSMSLKRRFTNVGISQAFKQQKHIEPAIYLGSYHFREGDSDIHLTNVAIEELPIAKMNTVEPLLIDKCLKISVEWYKTEITSTYEVTDSALLKILPVSCSGQLKIILDRIILNGYVGFEIVGEALKSTNFDLSFDALNITTEVRYKDTSNSLSNTSTIQTKEFIDETIAKHLKLDLYWHLRESFRSRLDQVLLDFTLAEIFNENSEIVDKFRDRGRVLDRFINDFVDEFLKNIRNHLTFKDKQIIKVPNFNTNFSNQFGFVTFWGEFVATGGSMKNLSTLKRTGKFSLVTIKDLKNINIFGSIGLEELVVAYENYRAHIWNIAINGNIWSQIEKNSFNLKIVGNFFCEKLHMKDIDIKIAQLDGIKVKATGLSFALNWLLSRIITWLSGHYKENLKNSMETHLRDTVQTYLLPSNNNFLCKN